MDKRRKVELFTKKEGVIGHLYPDTFEIELNLGHEHRFISIMEQLSRY